MSDGDLLLLLLAAAGLLVAAFMGGATHAREDMMHRLLGMKRINNRWEVRDGTELLGMKWVSRYWVYDDGREVRRINCVDDEWKFEDGTKPEKVLPFLREIEGHWESFDGERIDVTRIKPQKFAEELHTWVRQLSARRR